MKKFFLFVSFVVVTMAAQAKIWRVNNNPGVVADATTAQAAHNLAAAGDTIHLEPSSTNYGDVTCTKRLTWLSIGSFLSQNTGNQYSSNEAIAGKFTMQSGSQGSLISVYSSSNIDVYIDNITVIRSRVTGWINTAGINAFNLTVSQCYVNTYINFLGANCIAANNICTYISTGGNASAVINGNIIFNGGSRTIYNSVFQNNIIISGTYSFFNSNVSFNMTSGAAGLTAGNGNIFSVPMENVFVNHLSNPTVDKNLMLKPGSPAIGAGDGGIDMGAFGGSTPFVLGLQPAIPAITALSSPSASGTNSINVTFSAKSNQ